MAGSGLPGTEPVETQEQLNARMHAALYNKSSFVDQILALKTPTIYNFHTFKSLLLAIIVEGPEERFHTFLKKLTTNENLEKPNFTAVGNCGHNSRCLNNAISITEKHTTNFPKYQLIHLRDSLEIILSPSLDQHTRAIYLILWALRIGTFKKDSDNLLGMADAIGVPVELNESNLVELDGTTLEAVFHNHMDYFHNEARTWWRENGSCTMDENELKKLDNFLKTVTGEGNRLKNGYDLLCIQLSFESKLNHKDWLEKSNIKDLCHKEMQTVVVQKSWTNSQKLFLHMADKIGVQLIFNYCLTIRYLKTLLMVYLATVKESLGIYDIIEIIRGFSNDDFNKDFGTLYNTMLKGIENKLQAAAHP